MIPITEILKDMKKRIPTTDIRLPTPEELIRLQKSYRHEQSDTRSNHAGGPSSESVAEASNTRDEVYSLTDEGTKGSEWFGGSSVTRATSVDFPSTNTLTQLTVDKPVKEANPSGLWPLVQTPNLPELSKTQGQDQSTIYVTAEGPERPRLEEAADEAAEGSRQLGLGSSRLGSIPTGKSKLRILMWFCVCDPESLFDTVSLILHC